MNRSKTKFFSILLLILFYFSIVSVNIYAQDTTQKKYPLELNDKIPNDSKITIGKLDNGLTYYIRENHKPEKRAELRLVVKAGSVLEDDDQQGLAHLCEHMAFNGTKNFHKQELINYLESIGMKFGPELNASTSYDQTIYLFQIPTDSEHVIQKAFQILEDWAHNVSFDNNEIDKERGVVIEEWRLGRGAGDRMNRIQSPVLLKNSRYAVRDGIGKKEILESCKYETLKRFYKDWYRPDLMAVVVVGDIEKSKIEALIKEHFSGLTNPENPRERTYYQIPLNNPTLYTIASDKEATTTSVRIINKVKTEPTKFVKDFYKRIVESLFCNMLTMRLTELAQKPDAPFSSVNVYKTKYLGDIDSFTLNGNAVKDNKIEQCIDVLLSEYERVKKFGFTQTELDRVKEIFLKSYERMNNEKDKVESRNYIGAIINSFIYGINIPETEYIYQFSKKYLPTIKLSEVNALAVTLMTGDNRVIAVQMPEKEGLKIPTAQDLKLIVEGIQKKETVQYEDKFSSKTLLDKEPTPSPVIAEKYLKEIDVTEWTLTNGAKVVLKPTDFKNDEILFTATSQGGGTSLVEDKEIYSAASAVTIVARSGIGNYNLSEVQKYLAGKFVSVYPWIGELSEGFNGSCSQKDMETMFQMIYSFFTVPRKDSTAYLTIKEQYKTYLENIKASPGRAFKDTIDATMSNYNIRRKNIELNQLDEIDLNKALKFYKERFANAKDFTFFFVGKIDKEKIKPLIEKYIGGLPSINREDVWKDIGINYPRGVIEKNVFKGMEQKSTVNISFNGPFSWTPQNRWELELMRDVLDIKLREVIREEKSGSYNVNVMARPEHWPKQRFIFDISFGCDPKRVDELTKAVFSQLDSLKSFPTKDIYITKVKEIQKKANEVNLKENRFWLNSLESSYYHKEDPLLILEKDKMTDSLTPAIVQKKAKEIFDDKNYIKVVLYPEKK